MRSLLVPTAVAFGLVLVAFFVRGSLVRGQSRKRLTAPLSGISEQLQSAPPPVVSIFRRHLILPWILAMAVCAACFYVFGLSLIFCVAIAMIVGLLAGQVENVLIERKKAMFDQQLADALDLMISSLRAGASVVTAMERSAEESRRPLKGEFYNVLGLIRFGDDPRSVMHRLMKRVPLDSFRLFSTTLGVHFEVGGTLAPTLAIVGRIIRDRIEISRRVRSLTAQARISTIALIVLSYAIAYLMWRHDPKGVRAFATSVGGSACIAGSMILQAVGIVWQSAISKVRV